MPITQGVRLVINNLILTNQFTNMSTNVKKQKYNKLTLLYARLNELEETRPLIGTTQYYVGRRRVLVNHIEELLRDIFSLQSKTEAKKRLVVFEVDEDNTPELQELSIKKELVTEYEDNDFTSIAKLFGVKVPNDIRDREQYLVTTIQGLLQR